MQYVEPSPGPLSPFYPLPLLLLSLQLQEE